MPVGRDAFFDFDRENDFYNFGVLQVDENGRHLVCPVRRPGRHPRVS